MNYKIVKDKFEITGETIWRLEITEHGYYDFPNDYVIIIECKTEEGLLKNLAHYTKKYFNEIGRGSKIKKNRKQRH